MSVTLVCPTIVPHCAPTLQFGCPSTSTCPPTHFVGCPVSLTCPPTLNGCPAPTHQFICPPITHSAHTCPQVTLAHCPQVTFAHCPSLACHTTITPTTTVVNTTVVGTTVAGTTLHQAVGTHDPASITCMTMYCNQAPAQAAVGTTAHAGTAATVCTQFPPCPPHTNAMGCPRTSTCPPTYAPGCPSTSTCPPQTGTVVGPTGVQGCTQSPAQCGNTTWHGCPPQTHAFGCPSTSTCPPTHLLGCTCLPLTVGPVIPTHVC